MHILSLYTVALQASLDMGPKSGLMYNRESTVSNGTVAWHERVLPPASISLTSKHASLTI